MINIQKLINNFVYKKSVYSFNTTTIEIFIVINTQNLIGLIKQSKIILKRLAFESVTNLQNIGHKNY